jgi:hypothetical protein
MRIHLQRKSTLWLLSFGGFRAIALASNVVFLHRLSSFLPSLPWSMSCDCTGGKALRIRGGTVPAPLAVP